MEEIDLSGFPVIRLDQIPFVDSPTLLKACDEVAELMASFSSDGKRPPLVFYLQKQTQAMCQELAGRAAKQRMDSILNGAASPKRKESAPIASAMNNSDQQSTTTVNTEDLVSDFSNSKKAISFKPLPLPSELRRASEALNDQSKGEQNFSDSEGSSFKSSSSAPASAYSGTKIDIARARASNLAKSGELHSNGRIITSRSVDGVDEDSSDSGTQVSETTAKSNTTKPRRPRSSAETAPKKTSMDVINENFGNSFIVAPNEKKRRFYPKKKTESVESIKAKEKLDRRNAAMKRLMERREQREKELLMKKESDRKRKVIESQRARAAKVDGTADGSSGIDSNNGGDSDSEESVSGGDDNGVEVDQELVKAVEEATKGALASESLAAEFAVIAEQQSVEGIVFQEKHLGCNPAVINETIGINQFENVDDKTEVNNERQSGLTDLNQNFASEEKLVTTSKDDIAKRNPLVEKNSHKLDVTIGCVLPLDHGVQSIISGEKKLQLSPRSVSKNMKSSNNTKQQKDPSINGNKMSSLLVGKRKASASCTIASKNTATTEQETIKSKPVGSIGEKAKQARAFPHRADYKKVPSFKAKLQPKAGTVQAVKEACESTSSGVSATTDQSLEPPSPQDEHVTSNLVETDHSLTSTSTFDPPNQLILEELLSNQSFHDPVKSMSSSRASISGSLTEELIHFDGSNSEDIASSSKTNQSPSRLVEATIAASAEEIINKAESLSVTEDNSAKHCSDNLSNEHQADNANDGLGDGEEDSDDEMEIKFEEEIQKNTKYSSLLKYEDGVYISYKAADDLPGLRSWKLQSMIDKKAVWAVDLSLYSQEADAAQQSPIPLHKLFEHKSKARKKVSFGLVILALDCEEILLGKTTIPTPEKFLSIWNNYLMQFDENAGRISDQDPDLMFHTVSVCGNCHSICKKLENLLRTFFTVGSTNERNATENNSGTITGNQQSVRTTNNKENEDEKAVKISINMTVAEVITERNTDDALVHLSIDAKTTTTADLKISSETSPKVIGKHEVKSEASFPDQSVRIAVDDELDDDEPFQPIYQAETIGASSDSLAMEHIDKCAEVVKELPSSDSVGVPLNIKGFEKFTHSSTMASHAAPNKDLHYDGVSGDLSVKNASILKDVIEKSSNRISEAVTEENNVSESGSCDNTRETSTKLTQFYPHFGAIFPVAYGAGGAKLSELSARALVESMQIQAHLYEEWLEVMGDYSTVFSEERGIAENHYSEEVSDSNQQNSATVYKGGSRSLHYRVKSSRSEVFNIITDVFNNYLPSWEALPSGLGLGVSWNLLWTWSKPRINMTHLLVWQRVNHFEDSKQLTRKDLLKRNLQRYTGTVNIANYAFGCNSSTASTGRSKAAESFEIMPLTFLLPHEYTQFVQAFTTLQMLHNEQQNEASANNGKSAYAPFQNFWIMKPIGLSRGRGIKMIRDVGELAYSQASVVQKYIERPLCLNNYKFDLRIYVIVTSFKPLEAFIYKDGFARVSTLQYSLNPDDTNNLFIHLTNSSIQKHNLEGHAKDSPLYDKNDNYNTGEVGGSKISLLGPQGLWNRLKKEKIDTDCVWQGICAVVIKSLVVVDDKMNHQPCCFELFGYDVLIDQDLRSWLIEVNASPSLARENHIDKRVKNNLIKDIVQLLNPATYDRAALARILRRRLANIAKNKASMGKNDTELETDLRDILGDYLPRKYGEAPEVMGNFEMLCPETKLFSNIVKLKNKLFKASTN